MADSNNIVVCIRRLDRQEDCSSYCIIDAYSYTAKDIVARPRPSIPKSDFLIPSDPEYAYPSGHAVIVSAGAAVALMMFRNTQKRLAISLALAAEAALVCLSRVYVGGHYPLDVIGGILLGVGVSFIFVGIEKHIESLMMPIMNKIVKVKR